MSIILGLLKLHVEGTLVPYKPTIIKPDHPEGGRTLWLTPDTEMWCQPPGDHPDNRIDDETLAVVGDQLNAFARGDFMEMKVDIKRLDPDTTDVWEIRSHLGRPQLRVFGFFAAPKVFVATHYANRDDLEPSRGPKWNAKIQEVANMRAQLVGQYVPYWNQDPNVYVRNPR